MINRTLMMEMTQKFTKEMVFLKMLEEMMELGEVITKTLTKRPDLKPPIEKLYEELGDVEVRLNCLKELIGWDEVEARVAEKQAQIGRYIDRTPVAE